MHTMTWTPDNHNPDIIEFAVPVHRKALWYELASAPVGF